MVPLANLNRVPAYRDEHLSLEFDQQSASLDSDRMVLTRKEYELLLKLMSDPARVFTKEQLLREVWGFRSLGRTRTLDSHASRLRRKLSAAGSGPFVVNVWGVGYRLLEPWPEP